MSKAQIALLTAGKDRPYALGMAGALVSRGVAFDFIGSDEVGGADLPASSLVNFLNLRGDQRVNVSFFKKMSRILAYYFRLMRYTATAKSKVFHVLWNNKFEFFDRTLLMLFYKLLEKRVVFTAHNVNIGKRDGTDSWLNRATLKFQYQLCDHIFVHTQKMREELLADFSIPPERVTVIPLGINNAVPMTALTTAAARERLKLGANDKVILFFGQIAPYKGLEFLVDAFAQLIRRDENYRLIVVGRPKGEKIYWENLQQKMASCGAADKISQRIEFIPDADTELYFKAADVLVLPYTHIFQSGVLFLAYSFGLPVIAADVGSLKEEIITGKTGFVFPARDVAALERTIETFFSTEFFRAPNSRDFIKAYANERYSWDKVMDATLPVYSQLAKN